jgi:hypothetical protein
MANPLPPDRRGYGSLFRTSNVMKVPAQFLISYSASFPNAQDDLLQDTLCNICETRGNVKNFDPLAMGEGTLEDAPETGRTYLWSTLMLERNRRCPLCRLVWRTMLPYFRELLNDGPPNAVIGLHKSVEPGGTRWIELVAMVIKNTLDNQDQRGSGQVVSSIQIESWRQRLIIKVHIRRRAYPTIQCYTKGDEQLLHCRKSDFARVAPEQDTSER